MSFRYNNYNSISTSSLPYSEPSSDEDEDDHRRILVPNDDPNTLLLPSNHDSNSLSSSSSVTFTEATSLLSSLDHDNVSELDDEDESARMKRTMRQLFLEQRQVQRKAALRLGIIIVLLLSWLLFVLYLFAITVGRAQYNPYHPWLIPKSNNNNNNFTKINHPSHYSRDNSNSNSADDNEEEKAEGEQDDLFIIWGAPSNLLGSVSASIRHYNKKKKQDTNTEKTPPPLPPTTTTTSATTTTSFPKDFVWGTGTSSYQIEGAVKEDGRGPTIWDTFCHDGKHNNIWNNDTGDVACDHYHTYKHDIQIMKEQLNLKAYRFSIAWSRIFPNGIAGDDNIINQAGVDFYNDLIDTLLEHDIEPWITLFHWDLPQYLQDTYGGWLGDDEAYDATMTIEAFREYARFCFETFGDRVKHWITVNEPWTYSVNGYCTGVHAPGHGKNGIGNPTTEPYLVGHHLLLGHAHAVKLYKEEFQPKQNGLIGIANSGDYKYPLVQESDDDNQKNILAAQRAILFQMGWFTDPLYFGDYPREMKERLQERLPEFTAEEQQLLLENPVDFVGLNYYSSALASEPLVKPNYGGYWADIYVDFSSAPEWSQNEMGWNIVPQGCKDMLVWVSKRYNHPIIYITENGSAEQDDPQDYYEFGVNNEETQEEDGFRGISSSLFSSSPTKQQQRQQSSSLVSTTSDDTSIETTIRIIKDEARTRFFRDHIAACYQALQVADVVVNLKGYFAWSFMDNFEWSFGYSRRFGMYYVDFTSPTRPRIPKTSAMWYRYTIEHHGDNIVQLLQEGKEEEL